MKLCLENSPGHSCPVNLLALLQMYLMHFNSFYACIHVQKSESTWENPSILHYFLI